MYYTIAFVIALVILLGAYFGILMHQRVALSQELIAKAQKFYTEATDSSPSLLVLGDSTAVGVGASSPTTTVPFYLAQHLAIPSVENHAVSGAKIADLATQLRNVQRKEYDYILIMVGGNDIIQFHSAEKAVIALHTVFENLPQAKQTFLMPAGNVGAAPMFPWPVSFVYTKLNQAYHDQLSVLADEYAVTYVNVYEAPVDDPFVQDPELYLAKDMLHPSDAGYKLWFEKLKATIQN